MKKNINVLTLSYEHLIDVQQNIASFDDHSLHSQIFPQVFGFADLTRRDEIHWINNKIKISVDANIDVFFLTMLI